MKGFAATVVGALLALASLAADADGPPSATATRGAVHCASDMSGAARLSSGAGSHENQPCCGGWRCAVSGALGHPDAFTAGFPSAGEPRIAAGGVDARGHPPAAPPAPPPRHA